jgi:hypothetical protein
MEKLQPYRPSEREQVMMGMSDRLALPGNLVPARAPVAPEGDRPYMLPEKRQGDSLENFMNRHKNKES